MLTLRAGVGAGPPRSRGGVAKQLRISAKRVARLERTGLQRLRTLGKTGACATPATQTATAADVAPAAGLTIANPASPAGGRSTPPREKSGAAKTHFTAPTGKTPKFPPLGDVAGATATNPGGGINLTIPLIALVLAAIAVVLTRHLRRDTTPVIAGEVAAEHTTRPAPTWIPRFRSTMRGPGWNDPRPPADRPGEWSDEQRRAAAPEPEAQHEEWTPPNRRSPTHRH